MQEGDEAESNSWVNNEQNVRLRQIFLSIRGELSIP